MIPFMIVFVSSVLIPLITGLLLFRRLSADLRLLLLLFLIVATVEGYTFYLVMQSQNPYWVHHVYAPIEYALITTVLSSWQQREWVKKLFRLSIPPFVIFCLWDILGGGNLKDLNALTASIAYTLYVGMSAYTLVNLDYENIRSTLGDYRFWIGTGLLVYSAGGLAYFSFHDTIVANYLIQIWIIHGVLNIVAYLLYSVGFVYQARSWNRAGA
jgi:hypothetical protein